MPKVAVIGGGMAGLAAACILARRGIQVTVFETAPQLGGRARGVSYKGTKLDNGQHILLGAYKQTLALLKLANVAENQVLMRLPLQLTMLGLSKNTFSLKVCSALPAPLHILAGLLLAKGAPLTARFSAIKLMVWMKLNNFKLPQDEPLASFLQHKNQPEFIIKNLWEPLCLAALNTPLQFASTQIFLNVLRDSFAKKKTDSDMLLPRVDLSTLLAEPLAAYIRQHGGEIKTNFAIKSISQTNSGFLLNDEHVFSHVIIACAPHQLGNISVRSEPVEDLRFSYQPITTIYLQYAESTKLPQAMTGLVGSLAQWVFDKGQLCDQNGLMAVVISAHAPFDMPQTALAARVAEELKNAFPQLKKPFWHKVITEKRATFSCETNLARPAATTGTKNFYLAGDYIQGDYPATIEGAVRSGINAANYIINP